MKTASSDPLGKLYKAILDNSTGDAFWIAEILLDMVEKETGYADAAMIKARCERVDTALAARVSKAMEREAKIVNAFAPFAEFMGKPNFAGVPDDFAVTPGSSLAGRQITAGDLRKLAEAIRGAS